MKTLKIGILLFLLSLISLAFAVSMPTTELETPSNNCLPYIERITTSTGYACGGYFGNTSYKRIYEKIELKGYSCPKDFTWKFTASTNFAECTDCRAFAVETASKDPNGIYTGPCTNGKRKLSNCKTGYELKNGRCEKIPCPGNIGVSMAGSRFPSIITNVNGIRCAVGVVSRDGGCRWHADQATLDYACSLYGYSRGTGVSGTHYSSCGSNSYYIYKNGRMQIERACTSNAQYNYVKCDC